MRQLRQKWGITLQLLFYFIKSYQILIIIHNIKYGDNLSNQPQDLLLGDFTKRPLTSKKKIITFAADSTETNQNLSNLFNP